MAILEITFLSVWALAPCALCVCCLEYAVRKRLAKSVVFVMVHQVFWLRQFAFCVVGHYIGFGVPKILPTPSRGSPWLFSFHSTFTDDRATENTSIHNRPSSLWFLHQSIINYNFCYCFATNKLSRQFPAEVGVSIAGFPWIYHIHNSWCKRSWLSLLFLCYGCFYVIQFKALERNLIGYGTHQSIWLGSIILDWWW